MQRDDTIFALASAPGRAGVAVLRLSGPAAAGALGALTPGRPLPEPRRAALRRFLDPADGSLVDEGLALLFPAPASFTGEDVVELHLHGGPAVVAGAVAALTALPGLRAAEAGEFSRRAFANGRLDLTQAEAIADLVAAETAAQRRQALRQLDGALGALYEGWRGELIAALAHAEAELDFPDEDLPGGLIAAERGRLQRLRAELAAHLADGGRGERLRDGLSVVILGAPNAGKSSLLNRLARRDAAIVSATAGTTRDVVEVHLDLGGYPVVLADTAGLRESADEIESEGVRRALARAAQADLKLLVLDAEQPDLAGRTAVADRDTVTVLNKSDLAAEVEAAANMIVKTAALEALAVSARTGDGLDALLARLEAEVAARAGLRDAPALTRSRHRRALEDCVAALDRALAAAADELFAEDLRLAARALGRITGRVDVEDILDVVFADFCIGK